MSDYSKAQATVQLKDFNLTFHADSVQELAETLAETKSLSDQMVGDLIALQQVILAKGIFSDPKATVVNGSANPTRTQSPVQRPPSAGEGSAPECQCTPSRGQMRWLGNKGYRFTWYCPAPKGEPSCPALP